MQKYMEEEMVYMLATVRVVPGKMEEFKKVFEREMLPAAKKIGWSLAAQWDTTVGTLSEVTDLWAYDDLSHMQRVQEAMSTSPEFQKAFAHIEPLIAHESMKLMVPTALSSLK
jgi:NIPSNAP